MESLKRVIGIRADRHCGDSRHPDDNRANLPYLHRRESAQFRVGLHQSALRYFDNIGVDIQLHPHEPSQREFKRSRVHWGELAVLRVYICSYNLLLELVRHQWCRVRLHRCWDGYPITDMDSL